MCSWQSPSGKYGPQLRRAAEPAGRYDRLYIRATFGEVLATVGKTCSSWGSGLAFNAGDIIFGSSSVDFSLRASDPRSETAWLASVEIPLDDFSFAELVTLPGETGHHGFLTLLSYLSVAAGEQDDLSSNAVGSVN